MNVHTAQTKSVPIAYFVTPHGYGHAARAAAVMLAMLDANPNYHFHVYTKVPAWFFQDSGLHAITYHDVLTDIGLAQQDAMQEDLPVTIERLSLFLPFDTTMVSSLAAELIDFGCRLVLCDIAPLGIAAAKSAGLPSILVENFTWDWIYTAYVEEYPTLQKYITLLKELFSQADYHIQAQPACLPMPADLSAAPISRPIRSTRQRVRAELGLENNALVGLVTMGGITGAELNLGRLRQNQDTLFILPGASHETTWDGNLLLLPHHHGIYHPDLVNACDFVVGKLGYSTFAECYAAGVAYGFIPRLRFPESPPLAKFVLKTMPSTLITEQQFVDGTWMDAIPALINQPRSGVNRPNGTQQVAAYIRNHVLQDDNQ